MSRQTNCAHSSRDLERTEDVLLRKCNICKDAIFGVGTCFKCNGCSDYFHQICLQPEPVIRHSFYPAVNFSFSDGEGIAGHERCVACYQRIQGCLYVGSNEIYIHPFCLVNLTKSVSDDTINCHKKHMGGLLGTLNGSRVSNCLELDCQMSLSAGVKCFLCKKVDTDDRGFGWAYKFAYTAEGNSKELECHVACVRAKLNNNFLNQIVKHPNSTYDQKTYFLKLSRSKLEDCAREVAGLALPVAVAGLDLMISAFVGVPLVSILLTVLLESAAAEAERRLRRRPRGN